MGGRQTFANAPAIRNKVPDAWCEKEYYCCQHGFYAGAMVNARIVGRKKPYKTEESHLFLLDGPRHCTRYDEIEVEYQDANFVPKKDRFTGWIAQIIRHELDHVNGVLI